MRKIEADLMRGMYGLEVGGCEPPEYSFSLHAQTVEAVLLMDQMDQTDEGRCGGPMHHPMGLNFGDEDLSDAREKAETDRQVALLNIMDEMSMDQRATVLAVRQCVPMDRITLLNPV